MTYAIWVPLVPLLGWAANGLAGGRWGRRAAAVVGCGTVAVAFALAVALLRALLALPPDGRSFQVDLYRWFAAGPLDVPMRLLVDPLSVTMALIVTGVGGLIHLYSVGYMADDDAFA